MDCSTPGLPVHHQILEFTQTHVLKDSRNLSGNAGAVYYLYFLKAKNIHRLGTMKRGIQFLAGIIIKPALSRSVLTGLTLCVCLVLRTLSAWFYQRLMMLTCSAPFWIWLMNLPIVVQSLSHVQLFCDLMDCSMPGFPVLNYLLELARAHVHWVSDATQPSHPLSSPSPPALNLSQHQGLF